VIKQIRNYHKKFGNPYDNLQLPIVEKLVKIPYWYKYKFISIRLNWRKKAGNYFTLTEDDIVLTNYNPQGSIGRRRFIKLPMVANSQTWAFIRLIDFQLYRRIVEFSNTH